MTVEIIHGYEDKSIVYGAWFAVSNTELLTIQTALTIFALGKETTWADKEKANGMLREIRRALDEQATV